MRGCPRAIDSSVGRSLSGGLLLLGVLAAALDVHAADVSRGYSIPLIDLASETDRQIIVDREPGQYLGHPTTVLLEDQRTILCVYPKGHGKGGLILKRSGDGGLTWSERLPIPENWATSREVPTIHRVIDAADRKRLIVWSGLYPARLTVSEDDGASWTPLKAAGDWGGIVVMGFVEPLKTGAGHYLAMFHDDGRFISEDAKPVKPPVFTLYTTRSADGGLTWSAPEAVYSSSDVHLCEPGCIRSPDGRQLAVLLRENSRRKNSHIIFSNDEGQTWTEPREVQGSLTGDRHTGKYLSDGRLFISFRDTTLESPTKGDWVAWVGRYEDLAANREGQYRVRLMDNHKGADCAYPGVEVLPDGTIATTTYGHWTAGEQPYIVSVRLKLAELDARAAAMTKKEALPRLPRENLLVFRDDSGKVSPVKTPADWQQRRNEILRGAQAVMGPLPGDEKRCDLDVEVEEEVDCGSYVRRLITYASEPGCRTPAYLAIPKSLLDGSGRTAPAVLALHGTNNKVGHGVIFGIEQVANRQYGSELAEQGFVVIAPTYPLLAHYQPDVFTLGWQSGTLKAVWDNIRALDVLETLPFLKKDGYGAIGHSLGGHNSVYTAVFDDRIKVIVSSCGLDQFPDYYEGAERNWFPEKGWCQTRYMPRMAEYRGRLNDIPFDFSELIGALAPRHVLILAPTMDSNFRAGSVDRLAAAAQPVFELHEAGDALRVVHPDSGHDFPPEAREAAYQLLEQVLGSPR